MSTLSIIFFFFNDTATTEIYTLSLHDALPIWRWMASDGLRGSTMWCTRNLRPSNSATSVSLKSRPISLFPSTAVTGAICSRSEEHTSELQSRSDLVCRLLLEKKNKTVHEHLTL